MNEEEAEAVRSRVEVAYRTDSRRVLATLIRLLGDFDRAEEAVHDAFAAAAEQWPRDGIPKNPVGWLVSAGRFKAIDRMRRRARFSAYLDDLVRQIEADAEEASEPSDEEIADDQLRLIFTCCHPALAPEAQVALTLREVCGLTTEEIASAYLTGDPHRGAAHRPRQGEDPRRAHSLPGSGEVRAAEPARRRAPGHLSRLQRRLLGLLRRSPHPPRPFRRGDPSRPPARRASLRARGDGPPCADASARIAPRRAEFTRGRADPARRPGPDALEPRARSPRVRRWSRGRWRRSGSGCTRCKRRSRRSIPGRRP